MKIDINNLFLNAAKNGMELIIRSDVSGKCYVHLYYVNIDGAKIRTVYEIYTKNVGKELAHIEGIMKGIKK